jgi:von Willebrand factor type A domain
MKHCLRVGLVAFLTGICQAYLNKRDFDVPASLAKSASFTSGQTIRDDKIEGALLEGCFFTVGTQSGISTSAFDDHNTLTYGHPFAKTSYPLLSVDGVWYKPGQVPGAIFKGFTRSDGKISAEYSYPNDLGFRFTLVLNPSRPGEVSLTTEFLNTSGKVWNVALAVVVDAGLGWTGQDAWAWIDGFPVEVESISKAKGLEIWERGSGKKGLGYSITFPDHQPESVLIANWQNLAGDDNATIKAGVNDTIYDLTLKAIFPAVAVPAGGTSLLQSQIALMSPEFSESGFLRWDCPRFFSTATGALFPQDFPSTLTLFNGSGNASNSVLHTVLPYELISDSNDFEISTASGSWSNTTSILHVRENYAGDTVITVKAHAKVGQSVVDSLTFRIFHPISPFSDQGLSVAIDSHFVSSDGIAHVVFQAKNTQTGQAIFNLGKENLIVRENRKPVSDIQVGPDTTRGASQLDIVFILDVTGSMGEEINGVKNNIVAFGNSLSSKGVDYQLGMVTFLDVVEKIYPLSSDLQVFKNYVGQQFAHGGDDAPENSLDALANGAALEFRSRAKPIFIWITDETYHQSDNITSKSASAVLQTLLGKDVQVFCIGTKNYDAGFYSPIYAPTGGKFYDINGNFQDILLDIAGTRVSSRLMVSYRPQFQPLEGELILEAHVGGLGGSATFNWGSASGMQAAKSDVPLTISCSGIPCNVSGALGSNPSGTFELFDMRGKHVLTQAFFGTSVPRLLSFPAQSGNPSSLYVFRYRDSKDISRSNRRGHLFFNGNR